MGHSVSMWPISTVWCVCVQHFAWIVWSWPNSSMYFLVWERKFSSLVCNVVSVFLLGFITAMMNWFSLFGSLSLSPSLSFSLSLSCTNGLFALFSGLVFRDMVLVGKVRRFFKLFFTSLKFEANIKLKEKKTIIFFQWLFAYLQINGFHSLQHLFDSISEGHVTDVILSVCWH